MEILTDAELDRYVAELLDADPEIDEEAGLKAVRYLEMSAVRAMTFSLWQRGLLSARWCRESDAVIWTSTKAGLDAVDASISAEVAAFLATFDGVDPVV
jgi:hypothetical protein